MSLVQAWETATGLRRLEQLQTPRQRPPATGAAAEVAMPGLTQPLQERLAERSQRWVVPKRVYVRKPFEPRRRSEAPQYLPGLASQRSAMSAAGRLGNRAVPDLEAGHGYLEVARDQVT